MEQAENTITYVTANVGGQLFGVPISRVQDVFKPERITEVPLASTDVAGVLNLRGRIVTALDLRASLGLPEGHEGEAVTKMAIGIEAKGESYALLIDSIGDVMNLAIAAKEPNPVHLDPRIGRVSSGVYRLDNGLLVALEVDSVLAVGEMPIAA